MQSVLYFINFRRSQIDTPSQELRTITDVFPRRLRKRSTNLKIEGEFFHVTEHADKFIRYLLEKRAALLRTPTTLKLEGEMDTKTETGEKYIKYETFERPPLCKKFTELRLQGDHDNTTEKREKFIPFELQKRPPLVKKSTNLHLEGDISLMPEYRCEYIAYGTLERPKLALPVNHLKPGGVIENTENSCKKFDDKLHPTIPFLRDIDKKLFGEDSSRKTPTRLSRAQSFVKPSDLHSPVSRWSPRRPDITFTKASDSDISRASLHIDSGYQSKHRIKRIKDMESSVDVLNEWPDERNVIEKQDDFSQHKSNISKPVRPVSNKIKVSNLNHYI